MKVLVTGASGFIGGCVVKAVNCRGWTAIGISRLENENSIRVDVANESTFEELRGRGPFDAVVHCAGMAHRFDGTDEEYERVNVVGTRNVAEFAARNGARHFVHLSSVLVYGRHGNNIAENEICRPRDGYAASKLRSEAAAAEVGGRTGMRVTILRPAPVIGEGCKGNFDRLIRSIDSGRFVMIGGSVRKSLVYVGDVAEASVSALEASYELGISTYNVTASPETTDRLVELIYRSLGKVRPRIRIPGWPIKFTVPIISSILPLPGIRSLAKSLDTWMSEDVYSNVAIRNAIGFEARVPISEAVRKTVLAYKISVVD